MTNNQKGFYRNIKYYHLMLFSIILSLLLIINSNNAKNKRIHLSGFCEIESLL